MTVGWGTRSLFDCGLSRRELDVLGLMADGWSNESIAERLGVGVRSVESVVRSIFQKLDLDAPSPFNRRVVAVRRYLDERAPQR